MSVGKKIAHKVEATTGSVKKVFGRLTGNTRLRAEGRVGQIKGNTKLAADNVTDAFGH
ncbi:CsbD family protein [Mycobacterium sp. BMJ-28]